MADKDDNKLPPGYKDAYQAPAAKAMLSHAEQLAYLRSVLPQQAAGGLALPPSRPSPIVRATPTTIEGEPPGPPEEQMGMLSVNFPPDNTPVAQRLAAQDYERNAALGAPAPAGSLVANPGMRAGGYQPQIGGGMQMPAPAVSAAPAAAPAPAAQAAAPVAAPSPSDDFLARLRAAMAAGK